MASVQLMGPTALSSRLSRSLRREGHRVHVCQNLDAFAPEEAEVDPKGGCVLVDIDAKT
ncbi:hypothetical protein QTH97_36015 [Variovorax sp. J22R24]|uniref:hypothetical protein n=1 Tax=Variovorax gracilis TaxID=3053502 RepID=UPI0025754F8D|nr:hypothetical protein [Variovorax sp. J22R24]MDM0110340.1 hypothetical protein [Variovorax sp. J22R24]